mgnify:CR=1 FL=1|jgi:hypothetical protein
MGKKLFDIDYKYPVNAFLLCKYSFMFLSFKNINGLTES